MFKYTIQYKMLIKYKIGLQWRVSLQNWLTQGYVAPNI